MRAIDAVTQQPLLSSTHLGHLNVGMPGFKSYCTVSMVMAVDYLNRRLPRESSLIEVQPINFIPRSTSAVRRPKACSTPT